MRRFLPWLVILLLVWTVFGTIYVTVQQAQRSAANSPQIQMAQDAAKAVNKGELAATILDQNVDMAKSLAPFTIVYDKKGKVVIGSGYLNDKIPTAPIGMLQASNGQDYHAANWKAADNVKIAAVTTSSKDYYFLSGRSLKEVEKNETTTLVLTLLGAIVATCLLGLVFAFSVILQD